MKALVRITASSYEINDIVSLVEDSHVFGDKDIKPGKREVVSLGTLTDAEKSKLLMVDARPDNYAAISQISTFRSLATKTAALKRLHRRKYNFNNGVALKANAQVRD